MPEFPGNVDVEFRETTREFWVTNYNLAFWEQWFGDCPHTR